MHQPTEYDGESPLDLDQRISDLRRRLSRLSAKMKQGLIPDDCMVEAELLRRRLKAELDLWGLLYLGNTEARMILKDEEKGHD